MPKRKSKKSSTINIEGVSLIISISLIITGIILVFYSITAAALCRAPDYGVESKAGHVFGYTCTNFLFNDLIILTGIGIFVFTIGLTVLGGTSKKHRT